MEEIKRELRGGSYYGEKKKKWGGKVWFRGIFMLAFGVRNGVMMGRVGVDERAGSVVCCR